MSVSGRRPGRRGGQTVAEAQQRLLQRQAFSTAPVDDILAHIEDSLAEIEKEAGVTMLVSKWDTETLARYASVLAGKH